MKANYDHWFTVDYWTFEEAACLFAGINPSSYILESLPNEHHNQMVSATPNISKIAETYHLFLNSDWSDIDPDAFKNKRTLKESYISIAFKNDMAMDEKLVDAMGKYSFNTLKKHKPDNYMEILCPPNTTQSPESSLPTQNSIQTVEEDNKITEIKSGLEKDSRQHFDVAIVDAFNPLPIATIAEMFILVKDKEENLKKWKGLSSKASENGLSKSRASTGTGKKGSEFNPVLVANWLIVKGYIKPEKATHRLVKNMPSRSQDHVEILFPEYKRPT